MHLKRKKLVKVKRKHTGNIQRNRFRRNESLQLWKRVGGGGERHVRSKKKWKGQRFTWSRGKTTNTHSALLDFFIRKKSEAFTFFCRQHVSLSFLWPSHPLFLQKVPLSTSAPFSFVCLRDAALKTKTWAICYHVLCGNLSNPVDNH